VLEPSRSVPPILEDGWTALEKAAHHKPDYLLSDVRMPKMNGIEPAIAIRKMYRSTRTMLFSGQAGISDILLDAKDKALNSNLLRSLSIRSK
jgi:CheY-like chemotaxis protein